MPVCAAIFELSAGATTTLWLRVFGSQLPKVGADANLGLEGKSPLGKKLKISLLLLDTANLLFYCPPVRMYPHWPGDKNAGPGSGSAFSSLQPPASGLYSAIAPNRAFPISSSEPSLPSVTISVPAPPFCDLCALCGSTPWFGFSLQPLVFSTISVLFADTLSAFQHFSFSASSLPGTGPVRLAARVDLQKTSVKCGLARGDGSQGG